MAADPSDADASSPGTPRAEVFICYANADGPRRVAEELFSALTARGRSVFWDKAWRTSGPWDQAIPKILAGCPVTVVLLSKEWLPPSPHAVTLEPYYALEEVVFAIDYYRRSPANRRLIVASLDNVGPANAPYGLRRIQHRNVDDGIDELVDAIESFLQRSGVGETIGLEGPAALRAISIWRLHQLNLLRDHTQAQWTVPVFIEPPALQADLRHPERPSSEIAWGDLFEDSGRPAVDAHLERGSQALNRSS